MKVTGVKPRFVLPLPSDYFGNVMIVCGVTKKAGEILEEDGFGKGAWEMNEMTTSHSNEKFKNHKTLG